jgi:H+/Cl- antiporter ClcA
MHWSYDSKGPERRLRDHSARAAGQAVGGIDGKIFATSFTIGSGGSGGVFGPSLFIGAMLGGVVGQLGHNYFPEVITNPAAFALVGMAAFFAGVAKAPIGALLMVSEMTQGSSIRSLGHL